MRIYTHFFVVEARVYKEDMEVEVNANSLLNMPLPAIADALDSSLYEMIKVHVDVCKLLLFKNNNKFGSYSRPPMIIMLLYNFKCKCASPNKCRPAAHGG